MNVFLNSKHEAHQWLNHKVSLSTQVWHKSKYVSSILFLALIQYTVDGNKGSSTTNTSTTVDIEYNHTDIHLPAVDDDWTLIKCIDTTQFG